MGWTSKNDIERYFDPEPMSDDDLVNERVLRHDFRILGHTILDVTPPSADQSAAVRKLREALDTAIGAIRCQRRLPPAGPNAYLGETG